MLQRMLSMQGLACGTCRFISSPSKSALYGLHTHSLKRNVLQGKEESASHVKSTGDECLESHGCLRATQFSSGQHVLRRS